MEDFIYILLGIAWIGFSIYSQQKKLKKKQEEAAARKQQGGAEASEEAEAGEKSLFDRLFEDYEQEDAFEPVEQTWQEQPARETARPAGRYDSVEQVKSADEITEYNSGLSSDYYRTQIRDRIKKEKQEPKTEEAFEEDLESSGQKRWDFDLRNAVIYSAILERPYE